jgi:hypothetical protein
MAGKNAELLDEDGEHGRWMRADRLLAMIHSGSAVQVSRAGETLRARRVREAPRGWTERSAGSLMNGVSVNRASGATDPRRLGKQRLAGEADNPPVSPGP